MRSISPMNLSRVLAAGLLLSAYGPGGPPAEPPRGRFDFNRDLPWEPPRGSLPPPKALRRGGRGVAPSQAVRALPPRWRRLWRAKADVYGAAMAWRIVRRRRAGGGR